MLIFKKLILILNSAVNQENYCKRLANWFDDVKFAGYPLPGQEIEKSEKLANIFVMPDVLEDVSTRGGCERDLFFRETGLT